jgi:hypothetical protein
MFDPFFTETLSGARYEQKRRENAGESNVLPQDGFRHTPFGVRREKTL